MAYEELTKEIIDSVADKNEVFIPFKEVMEKTGITKTSLYNHIATNKVIAYRYRNRTYFTQDEAERYSRLVEVGLLG